MSETTSSLSKSDADQEFAKMWGQSSLSSLLSPFSSYLSHVIFPPASSNSRFLSPLSSPSPLSLTCSSNQRFSLPKRRNSPSLTITALHNLSPRLLPERTEPSRPFPSSANRLLITNRKSLSLIYSSTSSLSDSLFSQQHTPSLFLHSTTAALLPSRIPSSHSNTHPLSSSHTAKPELPHSRILTAAPIFLSPSFPNRRLSLLPTQQNQNSLTLGFSQQPQYSSLSLLLSTNS